MRRYSTSWTKLTSPFGWRRRPAVRRETTRGRRALVESLEPRRLLAAELLQRDIAPVAHWGFESASGNVVYDTATGGSSDNVVLQGDANRPVGGPVAKFLNLDGVDDYGTIFASDDIDNPTISSRTISLLFRADHPDEISRKQLLYGEGGHERGLGIYLDGNQLYVGGWNQSGSEQFWQTFLAVDLPLDNQWHHVALVLQADASSFVPVENGLRGYLDGIQFGARLGAQLENRDSVRLGHSEDTLFHDEESAGADTYFRGQLDEGRVYNDVLTDQEIEWLASERFTADFDGDGRGDAVDFPATHDLEINLSSSPEGVSSVWGHVSLFDSWNGFQYGDFTGDGRDDVFLRNLSTGTWSLARSDGNQFFIEDLNIVGTWTEMHVGDFDGDGADELLGWDSGGSHWDMLHYDHAAGGALEDNVWGDAVRSVSGIGTIHVGDANRDGRDDIVGFDSAQEEWYVGLSQSPTSGGQFDEQDWNDFFDTASWGTGGVEFVQIDGAFQQVLDIFSNVYNDIELELYAYLMKGATAADQTKAANDWDQTALLVDRFEAAGVDADIAKGVVDVPVEGLRDWLGVKTNYAAYIVIHNALDSTAVPRGTGGTDLTGLPASVIDANLESIEFVHAWVRTTVPTATGLESIDLDPSWKFKDRQAGIDIGELGLGGANGEFDEFAFLAEPLDVSGDVSTALPVEYFEDRVMEALAASSAHTGMSLADVAYDGPILTKRFEVFPLGVAGGVVPSLVSTYDNADEIFASSSLREQFTHRVEVSVNRIATEPSPDDVSLDATYENYVGLEPLEPESTSIIVDYYETTFTPVRLDISQVIYDNQSALARYVPEEILNGVPLYVGETPFAFPYFGWAVDGTGGFNSSSGEFRAYGPEYGVRYRFSHLETEAGDSAYPLLTPHSKLRFDQYTTVDDRTNRFGWDHDNGANNLPSGYEMLYSLPMDVADGIARGEIPIGDAVAGSPPPDYLRLAFGGVDPSTADDFDDYSGFGNLVLYEDHPGNTTIESDELTLSGHEYKAINLDYQFTEQTVLEFDFSASSIGTVHAVGWDVGNRANFSVDGTVYQGTEDSQFYRLEGDFLNGYVNGAGSNIGGDRYRIPIGLYLNGATPDETFRLIFINDGGEDTSISSTFGNVELYEEPIGEAEYNTDSGELAMMLTSGAFLALNKDYTITPTTILAIRFSSTDAADNFYVGWDIDETYGNDAAPQEVLASFPDDDSSSFQTIYLGIGANLGGASSVDIDQIIVGADVNNRGDGFVTDIELFEDATVEEQLNFVNGEYQLELTGRSHKFMNVNYAITPDTVLEFEFKSTDEGLLHGIGWDADGIAQDDAGEFSKLFRIHGSEFDSLYKNLPPYHLNDGFKFYSVPIGSYLEGIAELGLSSGNLVFINEGDSNDPFGSNSIFRNVQLREDIGNTGTQWYRELVVPEHSLDSVILEFEHFQENPSDPNDDRYGARLLANGNVLVSVSSGNAHRIGESAELNIENLGPTAYGDNSSLDRSFTYNLELDQVTAIGLDANQYSRHHLVELQADLNNLLADGADLDEIDELLNYTAAKYWHDYNASNHIIDGLFNTLGLQRRVGSGIVKADPLLIGDLDGDGHIDQSEAEPLSHLNFPIVPLNMGVDLPNLTHAPYNINTDGSSSSPIVDLEAANLVAANASALEHHVIEEQVNSQSVSTIKGLQRAYANFRGLNLAPTPVANILEAVQIFESVVEQGSRVIYWRGDIGVGPNIAVPYDPNRTTHPFTAAQVAGGGGPEFNDVHKLRLHDADFRQNVADVLSDAASQAGSNPIRVLVPRARLQLGDWIGSVYVAEKFLADGSYVASYIIDDGTPSSGGFSSNEVNPLNLDLPLASYRNQTYAGDPVNVANGNMFRDEVDILFPNTGAPLDFTRRYNSQSNFDIGLGIGWTHSFSDRLYEDPEDADTLIWYNSRGEQHRFTYDSQTGEYSVPASLHGHFETIAGGYAFYDKYGLETLFTAISGTEENGHEVRGRLYQIIDRNNHGIEVQYVGATTTIDRVIDVHDAGRRLQFTGTRVDSIHIIVDGSSEGTWSYSYEVLDQPDPNDSFKERLAHVATPTDSFISAAIVTNYDYHTSGPAVDLISRITEPGGETHDYEYYANRRAFRVTDAAGLTQSFNYNLSRNLTEFTDERGNLTTYIHQDNGLLTRQVHADRTRQKFVWGEVDFDQEFLMLSSTDEVGATETFQYFNEIDDPSYSHVGFGELKETTSVDGVTTTFTYFHPTQSNADHISELASITVESPIGSDLVTQFTYDSWGRLLETTENAGLEEAITSYSYHGYDAANPHLLGLVKSQTSPLGYYGTEAVTWQPLTSVDVTTGELTVYTAHESPVSGQYLVADAIRIDRLDPATGTVLESIIVDDEDAGFAATGAVNVWASVAWGSNVGAQMTALTAAGTTESATWSFTDLEGGTYQVSANWLAASSRASDVVYQITDGPHGSATPVTVTGIDQKIAPVGFASHRTDFQYDTAGNVTRIDTGRPATSTYEYGSHGNVTESTDPTGFVTISEYDILGRLRATGAATGSTIDLETTLTYDESGRLVTSTDPLGRVMRYQYDNRGQLVRQIFADGSSAQLEYDAFGNQTAAIDELGRATRFVYDARNRLIQTIAADGSVTRTRFDGTGHVSTSTDELGNQTHFDYDMTGRLMTTTSAADESSLSKYDALGRLVETVGPRGMVTQFEYDDFHRITLTRVLDADDPAVSGAAANSSPVTATITPVSLTTVDYDLESNRTREIHYDTVGLIAAGVTSTSGNPRDLLASHSADLFQVATFRYDSDGRMIEVTNPDDTATAIVYDAAGRVRYEVDELGRRSERRYDEYGRYVETVFPDPDGSGPEEGPVTTFVLDAAGNRIAIIDALGNRTDFEYDARNRRITTIDPLLDGQTEAERGRSRQVYDAAGQQVATVDPLGLATFTTFDRRGRISGRRLADPDAEGPQRAPVSQHQYDATGNLVHSIDPLGRETFFTYNELNQLDSESFYVTDITDDSTNADNPHFTTTGTWNAAAATATVAGDAISSTGSGTNTASWSFDDLEAGTYRLAITWTAEATEDAATLGAFEDTTLLESWNVDQSSPPQGFTVYDGAIPIDWQVVDTDFIHAGGPLRFELSGSGSEVLVADAVRLDRLVSRQYAYDETGNVTAETDPLGRVTEFAYDEFGRTTEVTLPDPDGAGSLERPATETFYDGFGNVSRTVESRGGGATERITTFTYDARNRQLTGILDAGGADEVTSRFVYDDVGNLTDLYEADATSDQRRTSYTYDDRDRRVTETIGAGSAEAESSAWTYDALGNLLTFEPHTGDTREVLTTFVYDALGRVTSETESGSSQARTIDFKYDAAGNLTQEIDQLNQITVHSYDRLHRLIRTDLPDPDNDSQTTNTPFTEFAYDPAGNLVTETNGEGEATQFAYGPFDQLVRATDSLGGETVRRNDAVGNLVAVTDPEFNTTRFTYDGLDRVTSEWIDRDGDGSALPLTREFAYNDQGNLASSTDRNGRTRTFAYDRLDRLTDEDWVDGNHSLQWQYDLLSRVTRQRDGDGAEARIDTFDYDQLDRVIADRNYDPNGTPSSNIPAVEQTFEYVYDSAYKHVREQWVNDLPVALSVFSFGPFSELFNIWERKINGAGPLAATPVQKTANFWYDEVGNLDRSLASTSYDAPTYGHATFTQYAYDGANRLAGIEHQQLDPADNLAYLQTYADFDYQYDLASRIVDIDSSLDGSRQFDYDLTGQLTGVAGSSSESFEYDDAGNRVTSSTTGDTVRGTFNRLVEDDLHRYTYDREGNLTSRTDKVTGEHEEFEWDYRNRLVAVTQHTVGAQVDFSASTILSYTGGGDGSGTATAEDAGQALHLEDRAARAIQLDYDVTSETMLEFDFLAIGSGPDHTGPNQGEVHSIGLTNDLGGSQALQLKLWGTNGPTDYPYTAGLNNSQHYVIPLGQLVTAGVYDYLTFRNIDTGQFPSSGAHGDADAGNTSFSNLRLYEASEDDAARTQYAYNADDLRTIEQNYEQGNSTPLATEHYIYDGDQLAMVFDAAQELTRRYQYGPLGDQVVFDEIFGDDGSGNQVSQDVLIPLADHQNSTRLVLTEDQTLLEQIDYGAFGNITRIEDGTGNPLEDAAGNPDTDALVTDAAFQGLFYDNDVDLHYNRGRWWDALAARFLSEDPLGLADDVNLYRRTANDPLNFTDPSGLRQAGNPIDALAGGFSGNVVSAPVLTSPALIGGNYVAPSLAQVDDIIFGGPSFARVFDSLNNTAITRSAIDNFRPNNGLPSPVELELAALRKINDPVIAAIQHPRVQGGLKIGQSLGEGIVGGSLLAFPEPVLSKVAGGVTLAKSVDTFQAGVRQLYTGSNVDSFTQVGAQTVAFQLGASDTVAGYVGAGVDSLPGLVAGGLAAPRLATTLADDVGRTATISANNAVVTPVRQVASSVQRYPIATTSSGKNFIPSIHLQAAAGEFNLVQHIQQIPDEVILKVNYRVTDTGADVITFNRRTGHVTLYDNKSTIGGRPNSAGVRPPKTIRQSETFSDVDRRASAIADARRVIRQSNLPRSDTDRALQSLRDDLIRTRTVGSGNAKNSVLK